MLENDIKRKIREMYSNRRWEKRTIDVIIEFVINFQKIYGEKYIDRILNRLEELKEIKEEYNDSKYQASSKYNFIIFYKQIKDDNQYKYILQHELFHFIQKAGSLFEVIPKEYENILCKDINILLLEEAFVQYFTAVINNKNPEYIMKDEKGKSKKYWLNECYKEIVGYVEELEEKIGREILMDMYMEDKCYQKIITQFDKEYKNKPFSKYIEDICKS